MQYSETSHTLQIGKGLHGTGHKFNAPKGFAVGQPCHEFIIQVAHGIKGNDALLREAANYRRCLCVSLTDTQNKGAVLAESFAQGKPTDGTHFFALEDLPGVPMEQVPPEHASDAGDAFAKAVDELWHKPGLFHGDLVLKNAMNDTKTGQVYTNTCACA